MVMATDFCSSGVLVKSLLLVLPNDGTTGTSKSDVSSTPKVFLSALFLVSIISFSPFFLSFLQKGAPNPSNGWRRAHALSFDGLNGKKCESLQRSLPHARSNRLSA